MRKLKEVAPDVPDDPPIEIACENCAFWDTGSPNGNEALFNPHEKHRQYLCRWWPTEIYKEANDWCAQFQADHSKGK